MAFSKLNIKDKSEAKRWQKEVVTLDAEVAELLKNVGKTLQDIKKSCDGTIIDELYHYGSGVMEASNNILDAMDKLSEIVDELLHFFDSVVDKGVATIKNHVRNMGE